MSETLPRQEYITDEQMRQFEAEFPDKVIRGEVSKDTVQDTLPGESLAIEGTLNTDTTTETNVPNFGRVEDVLHGVRYNIVPDSVETAEQMAEELSILDELVRSRVSDNSENAQDVERALARELHTVALAGIDNWRLGEAGRAQWAEVVGMSNPKHLSEEMKAHMAQLSPDAANETPKQQFGRLKNQAHSRLTLDEEIVAKYGQDDLPRTERETHNDSKATTGTIEGAGQKATAHEGTVTLVERPRTVPEDDWALLSEQQRTELVADMDNYQAELDAAETAAYDEAPQHKTVQLTRAQERAQQLAEIAKRKHNSKSVSELAASGYSLNGETTQSAETDQNAVRPNSVSEADWDMFTEAERRALVEALNARHLDDTQAIPVQQPEQQVIEGEPMEFTTRGRRVRNALRNPGAYAAARVQTLLEKNAAYFSDAEKGKRRKVAAGVGAIAVLTAGAYLATRGHDTSSVTGSSLGSGTKGVGEQAKHVVDSVEIPTSVKPSTVELTLGRFGTGKNTVWGSIDSYTGHKLTDAELVKVTGRVLKENGLTWSSARTMHVGDQIQLSESIQRQLEAMKR